MMLLYSISFCISLCIITSHTINGEDFQIPIGGAAEMHNCIEFNNPRFLEPIKFTNNGLRCFIRHVYNTPEYPELLANNWGHLDQFLRRQTPQPRSYFQSVFRMFGNKLKQSSYINAYAFSEMLDEVTPLLQKVISPDKTPTFAKLQKEISKTMYNRMLNKFDYLKLDPDAYFKDLSDDILTLINNTHELSGDSSMEELRKSLMVFFELSMNKLIWSPLEYDHAWNNVKLLCSQITKLHEQDILDDQDDLNSLFITLLERFCLFLDLSYSEIPLTFYAKLRQETKTSDLLLFQIEDEPFFETKSQRLNRAITMAEAKTRAYHEGILVS